MVKVFICYASEDLSSVEVVVQCLEKQEDISVWFAKRDVRNGEVYEQVRRAIRTSSVFIFCASKASSSRNPNSFFSREQQEALACMKSDPAFRVLSIKFDNDVAIPEYFGYRTIDLSNSSNWDANFSKLTSAIRYQLVQKIHREE